MPKPESTTGRSPAPSVLTGAWVLAATLFFILSLLWCGSKLRHTGDTWVGLAAGQKICEQGYFDFPLKDQWTFLYEGHTWWNQNWLTHVAYWLVYHYLSPGSLVWFKLFLVVLTGLMLWDSCERLSGSRPIALLAASAGLLVLSEFVDIRPNHVGIVCSGAIFWMLLRLKHGGRWAIWWIPVLMLVWGNAHGSFLFGYALIFMFVVTEGLQRLVRRRAVLATWKDLVWLCGTTAFSAVALALVSPYGLENFSHPLVIMVSKDSETYQKVMEWMPSYFDIEGWFAKTPTKSPYWFPSRPWVGGYWWLVAVSVLIWAAAVPLWLFGRRPPGASRDTDADQPAAFDVTEWAFVVVAVYFSLTSRRFVPLFVLFTLPVTAKMIVLILRSLNTEPRSGFRVPASLRPAVLLVATLVSLSAGAFLAFAGQVWSAAQNHGYDLDMWRAYLSKGSQPYDDYVFERHTGRNPDLVATVEFMRTCGLSGRVYNEWTWGGFLMFEAPELKLFIDGRSQALFPAEHFENYWLVKNGLLQARMEKQAPGSYPSRLDAALQEIGVNIVLLKRQPLEWSRVIEPLIMTELWEPIFESEHAEGAMLLVRKGSGDPKIEATLRKFYAGELEWPDTKAGWRVRGYAMQRGPNPNWRGSIEALKRSLEIGPDTWVYDRLVLRAFDALKDRDGAIRFFNDELARLSAVEPGARTPEVERSLLTVRRAIKDLQTGIRLEAEEAAEAEKARNAESP